MAARSGGIEGGVACREAFSIELLACRNVPSLEFG